MNGHDTPEDQPPAEPDAPAVTRVQPSERAELAMNEYFERAQRLVDSERLHTMGLLEAWQYYGWPFETASTELDDEE